MNPRYFPQYGTRCSAPIFTSFAPSRLETVLFYFFALSDSMRRIDSLDVRLPQAPQGQRRSFGLFFLSEDPLRALASRS